MARLDRFYLSSNWDIENFFTEIASSPESTVPIPPNRKV